MAPFAILCLLLGILPAILFDKMGATLQLIQETLARP